MVGNQVQLAMHMVNPLGRVSSALCQLHQLGFMGPCMPLLSPAPRLGSRANDGVGFRVPPHERPHAMTIKNTYLRGHCQSLLLPACWILSGAQTDSDAFKSTQCKIKSVDLLSDFESIHDTVRKLLLPQPSLIIYKQGIIFLQPLCACHEHKGDMRKSCF